MNSDYLKYVDECSNKGEEPLTEQQYNFCTEDKDWFTFEGGTYRKATKEQQIAMYTECIREEFCPDHTRIKKEGYLIPWWYQAPGFREGKIEEPCKTFIKSIDEFEHKINYDGYVWVTKDVIQEILNKLMEKKRKSVIEDGIEYYVLSDTEKDLYIELLI